MLSKYLAELYDLNYFPCRIPRMSNIKLTYDYTLNSIKALSESVDKINVKLSFVLTLSGVLINFGKDLPGYNTEIQCHQHVYPCLTCYLFQIGAYFLTKYRTKNRWLVITAV